MMASVADRGNVAVTAALAVLARVHALPLAARPGQAIRAMFVPTRTAVPDAIQAAQALPDQMTAGAITAAGTTIHLAPARRVQVVARAAGNLCLA